MLVVPRDQLLGHLERSGVGLGCIYRLLDRSARGARAPFDHDTGFLGRARSRLAQVYFLCHLDQQFAHHIAAKKFVIRSAA
jgi:hypothetical protein